MPYMSVNRWGGFGSETTWGTAVTPSVYLQVDTNPGIEPQVTYLLNKALYGAAAQVYGTIAGVQYTKASIKGNAFTDTFPWLMKLGRVDSEEMDRVFNMGIGLVLIVAEYYAEAIVRHLRQEASIPSWIIGEVVTGDRSVTWGPPN